MPRYCSISLLGSATRVLLPIAAARGGSLSEYAVMPQHGMHEVDAHNLPCHGLGWRVMRFFSAMVRELCDLEVEALSESVVWTIS